MEARFLVVGEALTDSVSHEETRSETPGGSPLNVAVGIARLGHQVTLAARVGQDSRGLEIMAHAMDSGVSLIEDFSGLSRTSSATATIAPDGSASYEFDLLWDFTPDMVHSGDCDHVHTGSIGATLEPGATGVAELLRREKAKGSSISYDPNARPSIMGRPDEVLTRVEELVGLSDIVKASDEDIAWLYPGKTLQDVVSHWRSLGPQLVVVTQGANGVVATLGSIEVSAPTLATHLHDTIGAGDSFMAGLLVALSERGAL
ncbi:MAG: hypothetical protein RL247_43, partial [Actinomycetota bacterium]